MRIALSGVAVLALAATSISAAFGQTSSDLAMKGCTMSMGSTMMPHCTPRSGPVVWYVAASKKYYPKGSATYGKGKGMYVCRAVAVARGGKPGASAMGGGSMGHGAMGTETHGSMTGAPMTMAPRPMSSGSGTMTSPGPGTMASPAPSTSPGGAMTNASGNQGNTGAPGAGGQVPNNPASTPNSSPRPNASPSMHP